MNPSDIPASSGDWDRLSEIDLEGIEEPSPAPSPSSTAGPDTPSISTGARLAVAWGDLVVSVSLTTLLVGSVFAAGYPVGFNVLPWSAGVGLVGWAAITAILLRVRRQTPGMVLAGLVFSSEVSGSRLFLTLSAAVCGALSLGLAFVPTRRARNLLSAAAGSDLTADRPSE